MGNVQIVDDGLDIMCRATNQEWLPISCYNIIDCSNCILLKLCNGINILCIGYIKQVMWY